LYKYYLANRYSSFPLIWIFDSNLSFANSCLQMALIVLPNDEHQSGLHEASPVVGDANNGSPSSDNSPIAMRREASPRLQSAIEFSAPCSDGSNGYRYQTVQPIRGRHDTAERIVVPQEVRAGTTEHNASLERHVVTIQTLPNTAWRMASTQLERGSILLTIFLTST
jgi:hypothetical protein